MEKPEFPETRQKDNKLCWIRKQKRIGKLRKKWGMEEGEVSDRISHIIAGEVPTYKC